jgi:hypothetical protein
VLLREIFAVVGLDVKAQEFAKGELAASLVKASLEKVVEVASEVVKGFVELVQSTAEAGKELVETAQSTGLTTAALQQLQDVAGGLGVDTETLNVGLFHLSSSMREAQQGSEMAQKAFSQLGIKATDSHGKLRNTDDVLMDLADRFSKMPDGAQKTAIAMDVLGRSGARLIPVLDKGREGLAELRAEQDTMTDEQLAAGRELIETQYALHLTTRNLWRQAIAPLLPAITNLIKRYLAWQKANAGIMKQKIQKYIGLVISAINKLAGAFSFLVRNAAMVKAIVITGLVIGFAQLEAASVAAAAKTALAWVAAAAPFVALAALIAGILLVFDDIRVYQHGGTSLYGRFKKEIDDWLKPRDQDPWFVAAIKDFVRLLNDALRLIDEFYEAIGRVNPRTVDKRAGISDKEKRRRADNFTLEVARKRAAMGLPLDEQQKAAIQRTGVTLEGFQATYGAKGPLAPPTADQLPGANAGPVMYQPEQRGPMVTRQVVAPVKMDIYAAPGMSEERVGQIAKDKIEEHWNGQMEDAAASVGP